MDFSKSVGKVLNMLSYFGVLGRSTAVPDTPMAAGVSCINYAGIMFGSADIECGG